MAGIEDLSDNLICSICAEKLEDGRELANSFLLYKLFYGTVEFGCVKIIEEALRYGINVNLKFENGYMPLHVAVINKREEVAELLISYAADVNAKDGNKNTPIFYATKNDDLKMTELLLTNEANVKDNPQLLINAVANKNVEMIEILLQHGADANARDAYGQTALSIVAVNGNCLDDGSSDIKDPHYENLRGVIAKLVLSWGANVNTQTRYCNSALQSAIEYEHVKVVEALLEYNANVNPVFSNTLCLDMQPLYASARRGNVAISKMLLNKGADVNATTDDDEMTALHIATFKGHKDVIEVLLRCGARVNSKNNMQMTPLHIAVSKMVRPEIDSIAGMFLKFGADIDSKDAFGRTALHIASRNGHRKIVIDLLKHGCDINSIDLEFHTPLFYADAGISSFSERMIVCYVEVGIFDKPYVDPHGLQGCQAIFDILTQLVIKMKAAKLYVSNKNLQLTGLLGNWDQMKNFHHECERELAYMKNEKINNTNVSYYDIFTKDTHRLVKYARNENIIQAFRSDDLKMKFPKYFDMIESNFMKGKIRKELSERCYKFFCVFVKGILMLPYNCIEKIFCNLSDDDLSILICSMEKERKNLLEQGYRHFHFFLSDLLPEFSYNCTEKIFSYLSDQDLRILIEACKPTNKFE